MDAISDLARRQEIRPIMVGLCLVMLLSALDQTIVATALPTIGADFGDFEGLPWIVTAYLIASTAVTPLYGKLADIHGRRIMLLIGVGVFVAGSVACALAPSLQALAFARAVQGMGGGGLISLAQTIVADLVSPRERPRYQTYFAAVFVTSSLVGPVLGGFFAQYLHWSLIFWINLPLGYVAFKLTYARLAHLPIHRHPHGLDFIGAGLLILASGLLVAGLGRSGKAVSPQVALLAASALFWLLFAWRTHAAAEPFIPLDVLRNRIAREATLSGAFGLGAFIGLSVVMPLYFEKALELSAAQSGLALIPMMVATVIGATLCGRSMAHVEHYKTPPLIGLASGVIASLFLAWRIAELSLFSINFLLTVVCLGVGAALPVSTVSVQNAVASRDLGAATAVMQFFRQLGSALLAALLGALVMGGGGVAEGEGLAAAFRLVFVVVAGSLALSFFFLARMEEKPLRGDSIPTAVRTKTARGPPTP